MKCEKLFKKIDELYPEYVKVWEDICNIESPTGDKSGVDAVCSYLVKIAEEKNWETEIFTHPVAGNAACITMNPKVVEAPVCLSGHMDTVHPVGMFGNPPVKIENGKIYGPGVIDCKGGIAAALLAMDALSQIGFSSRPVKLILQSDEETGSRTSGKETIRFMYEMAKGSVAFFNTESCAEENQGTVVMERKGILRFNCEIKGKAAHSSKCNEGSSAIAEAAYKIIEFERMKNPDGLTFNCGVIEGGTVANTVPAQCSFQVDIRFATEKEEKEAREIVQRICNTSYVSGCTCNVKEISNRPPMEYSEKNFLLLDKINEIYKQNGLQPLKPRKAAGGSDAAYMTVYGIPCLDNIGVVGGGLHSIDEYSILSSIADSAKYMAAATYLI